MQLTLRMISAAGFADADLGLPEVPTVTEIYIPSAFVLWIRICEFYLSVATAGPGVICDLDHRSALVMHVFAWNCMRHPDWLCLNSGSGEDSRVLSLIPVSMTICCYPEADSKCKMQQVPPVWTWLKKCQTQIHRLAWYTTLCNLVSSVILPAACKL